MTWANRYQVRQANYIYKVHNFLNSNFIFKKNQENVNCYEWRNRVRTSYNNFNTLDFFFIFEVWYL